MPYIGNTIRAADDYRLIDDISSGFNGSETCFALQVAGSAPVPFPKSPQQVLISVNGVIQEPDPTGSSGFNLVGTNIVFSSAPTNGHAFFGIIYATADYLNAGGNFPSGSLGAPSITFIGDENTGLYRKSGGSVGFVSDATEIANFDSNGITISSGNIIIPDSIIHNGDTNTKIRFPSADTISAETAGSEALRITSTGRLGINETNPGHKLVVGGDIGVGFTTPNDAARQLNFNVNRGSAGDTLANINWQWNSKFVAQIRGIAGSDTTNKDDAHLAFFTSAANNLVERMRITRAGVVNIGAGANESGLTPLLHLNKAASAATAYLHITNTDSGITNNDGFVLGFNGSNDALVFNKENTPMRFATNGSERMRINTAGSVLIGTTSDSIFNDTSGGGFNLKAGGQLVIAKQATSAADPLVWLNDTGQTTNKSIVFAQDGSEKANIGLAGNDATITVNGSERMRIDSSGRLLIGTTSTDDYDGFNSTLQVTGGTGDASSITVSRFSNNGSGANLILAKSRTGTIGNNAVLQAGDNIGNIQFHGNDGSGFHDAAMIKVDVASGVGNNDVPADLIFSVNGGTTGVTERMRIASSGNVGIGVTDADESLEVNGAIAGNGLKIGRANNVYPVIQRHTAGAGSQTLTITAGAGLAAGSTSAPTFNDALNGAAIRIGGGPPTTDTFGGGISYIANGHTSPNNPGTGNQHVFYRRTAVDTFTEACRIDHHGGLRINSTGTVTADELFSVQEDGTAHELLGLRINSQSHTKDLITMVHVANSGDRVFLRFKRTGSLTNVGNINTNTTITAFNTSSDYRLKENEVLISDGITRLKQLKPYRFNFKIEPDKKVDGFYAHEVSSIIPEAVTGQKDAMEVETYYKEGDTLPEGKSVGDPKTYSTTKIEPQGLDYAKFTPLLTAALQEEIAKREALEARVAALESA